MTGKRFTTEMLAEPAPVPFDPASCARTLRIAGPDYEIALFGSFLTKLCSNQAPDMRLVMRAVTPKQALKDLLEGDVDLALGHFPSFTKGVVTAPLYEETYRVAARFNHARIAAGALDLETYLAQDHIIVSAGGGTTEIVDEILAQQGKKRRVVAAVPIFLSALAAVAGSEAIVTMPAHLIALYAEYFHLHIHESPVAIPPFHISAAWRRGSHDPAAHWLVERIKSEANFMPLTN
ncbi:MAG TPA: LysR substrate-binding domain-containing protein [Rhizomicrobium sp.]